MKILTVEDNEINAKLMDHMLKDLDFEYEHIVAEDADRALELTSADTFDLILMDINLGHGQMDGSEVMQVLKNKDEFKNTPMYAVTCYSLPGDRERFLEEGFDKYFSKPINHASLLEAIKSEKK
ncbi:MAG: response regulator [Ekhidna sp.]